MSSQPIIFWPFITSNSSKRKFCFKSLYVCVCLCVLAYWPNLTIKCPDALHMGPLRFTVDKYLIVLTVVLFKKAYIMDRLRGVNIEQPICPNIKGLGGACCITWPKINLGELGVSMLKVLSEHLLSRMQTSMTAWRLFVMVNKMLYLSFTMSQLK